MDLTWRTFWEYRQEVGLTHNSAHTLGMIKVMYPVEDYLGVRLISRKCSFFKVLKRNLIFLMKSKIFKSR